MKKIKAGDLYIDRLVNGNTIWTATSELPISDDLVLVAESGTELWRQLFPLLTFEGNTEAAKDMMKTQRCSWLKHKLDEIKAETNKKPDDTLIKLRDLLNNAQL